MRNTLLPASEGYAYYKTLAPPPPMARATFTKVLKKGEIQAVKKGRHWHVTPQAIDDYLRKGSLTRGRSAPPKPKTSHGWRPPLKKKDARGRNARLNYEPLIKEVTAWMAEAKIPISSPDVQDRFGISAPQARKLWDYMDRMDLIERVGHGKYTSYLLAKGTTPKVETPKIVEVSLSKRIGQMLLDQYGDEPLEVLVRKLKPEEKKVIANLTAKELFGF